MKVKRLSETAKLPVRSSPNAAGYDLFSNETIQIEPKSRNIVATDISVAIPHGYYGRIASRSGLSWKFGLEVGAGVIDSDYRGNIKVVIYNHSIYPYLVSRGDKIAQMIIEKIDTPEVVEVDDLDDTERSGNGFGSTGL